MLVRMLDRKSGVQQRVMGTDRSLLDLPEERALQLVMEGICVLVPSEGGLGSELAPGFTPATAPAGRTNRRTSR